jgi:hypothetical protein
MRVGNFFGNWAFLGRVQRRGTDVSVPKIGSRDGVYCFGGILRFCAELRREFNLGNWDLLFFWGSGRWVAWGYEEEGPMVCI